MALEGIKREFLARMQTTASAGNYFDRQAERDALMSALSQGVTVDIARATLMDLCQQHGYLLESTVLRDARHKLSVLAANHGKISEKAFLDITDFVFQGLRSRLDEKSIRRMLCEVIDDHQYPIQRGFFSGNWYGRIKQQAGLN
jgi:hypothetical protein